MENIQDKTAIQNALSGVTQWAGEANTLLAFNEAYRQMNLVQSSELNNTSDDEYWCLGQMDATHVSRKVIQFPTRSSLIQHAMLIM